MILQLPGPISAQKWCRSQVSAGNSIGYVPTMGALHDGHLSLVRRAVAENDVVCVSIFVNPLQFGDSSDYEHYPRDIKKDTQLLHDVGCHMVFVGTLEQFFPEADQENIRLLKPGRFAEGLEGESRPGHFSGVSTIVDRLFHYVQPHRAYFGEKDFQQTLVVKDLVKNARLPEIVVCPTSREPSGLARSSRNVLLSHGDREEAACIYQSLIAARSAWQRGIRDADSLRNIILNSLQSSEAEIEYIDLRDPDNWDSESPRGNMQRAQALVAVKFGDVRLIDNLRLDSAEVENQPKSSDSEDLYNNRSHSKLATNRLSMLQPLGSY
ncbi:pantoate--beta-alanine ligase [Pseudomonadota bacterium]